MSILTIPEQVKKDLLTGKAYYISDEPYPSAVSGLQGTLRFNKVVFDNGTVELWWNTTKVGTMTISSYRPGDTVHFDLVEGVMTLNFDV